MLSILELKKSEEAWVWVGNDIFDEEYFRPSLPYSKLGCSIIWDLEYTNGTHKTPTKMINLYMDERGDLGQQWNATSPFP